MSKQSLGLTAKSENNDFMSALISNIGVLVQIAGISLIGLTDAFGITKIFVDSQLIGISNFFIFIVTFSFIATYTFTKDNKPVTVDFNKDPFALDKKLLLFLSGFTTFFFLIFLMASYQVIRKKYFINSEIVGLLQILTYSGILITGTLNVYIWIRDAFSKQSQFDSSDFLPNLLNSLRENGYLKEPNLKISENIILNNSNRLVTFELDEIKLKDVEITYNGTIAKDSLKITIVTTFDGKIILKELSKEEKENLLKN